MNPAAVQPFHAMAISRQAYILENAGRSVIHMEFGQPSTGAPPRAIAAAHYRLDSEAGGYWESPALCERIARLYAERHGLAIDPGRIVLTNGASPALALALAALFAPGDRIAFARPGYVAYRNAVLALGRVPVEIGTDATTRFQIAASHIAALPDAPQGLIIASPANPTGTMIDVTGLAAIATETRRRGIRIISDEIYHGLTYDEPAHSILEFDSEAIVISSFSKYYSMPGWRLGWIVAPTGTTEHLRAYIGSLFLTPPTLSQHAALAAMDETRCLKAIRTPIAATARISLARCPGLGLPALRRPMAPFTLGSMSVISPMTAWLFANNCLPTPGSPSRRGSISILSTAIASSDFPLPSARTELVWRWIALPPG